MVLQIGDRDAEMRDAAREIRGAVDRIDDPDAVRGLATALFADEGVGGKGLGEALLDEALDLAIDLGEEILMALEGEAERGAVLEAPAHQLAGLARQALRA
jgi:GNAT superfamily N-acetyltransferase